MSPTRAARVQRGVSWFFMVVATFAIVVGYIRLDNNQEKLRMVQSSLCQAVVQLTPTVSEKGVTDRPTLDRIRATNEARRAARATLSTTFACDAVPKALG